MYMFGYLVETKMLHSYCGDACVYLQLKFIDLRNTAC